MIPQVLVHDSSGNIFEDMGMSDAGERLAKAGVARLIRIAIRGRGLEQEDAAVLLGVPQADVEDLVRGRLGGFSLPRLEEFRTVPGLVDR